MVLHIEEFILIIQRQKLLKILNNFIDENFYSIPYLSLLVSLLLLLAPIFTHLRSASFYSQVFRFLFVNRFDLTFIHPE